MEHLLQVTGLTKVYGKRGAATRALAGVDLTLEPGQYVGVLGGSAPGLVLQVAQVVLGGLPVHRLEKHIGGGHDAVLEGQALHPEGLEQVGVTGGVHGETILSDSLPIQAVFDKNMI